MKIINSILIIALLNLLLVGCYSYESVGREVVTLEGDIRITLRNGDVLDFLEGYVSIENDTLYVDSYKIPLSHVSKIENAQLDTLDTILVVWFATGVVLLSIGLIALDQSKCSKIGS